MRNRQKKKQNTHFSQTSKLRGIINPYSIITYTVYLNSDKGKMHTFQKTI